MRRFSWVVERRKVGFGACLLRWKALSALVVSCRRWDKWLLPPFSHGAGLHCAASKFVDMTASLYVQSSGVLEDSRQQLKHK